MTTATCKKLLRLGYSEEFINSIIHFRKDSSKRFIFRVTDIDNLHDAPRTGEFICYASFDHLDELKEICDKLEGFAYEYKIFPSKNDPFKEGSIIDEETYEEYAEMIKELDAIECERCGKWTTENDFKYVQLEDGMAYLCPECLKEFGQCELCKVWFYGEDLYAHKGGILCADCYDEVERYR